MRDKTILIKKGLHVSGATIPDAIRAGAAALGLRIPFGVSLGQQADALLSGLYATSDPELDPPPLIGLLESSAARQQAARPSLPVVTVVPDGIELELLLVTAQADPSGARCDVGSRLG